MELCRIQWGSKNISRIIFGSNSSLGLKEINYSLPINFEVPTAPETFLATEEARRLLMVEYQGNQIREAQYSLMNFNNSEFLLANIDNPNNIANVFNLTLPKAVNLGHFAKRLIQSLKTIDKVPEQGFVRGNPQMMKRSFLWKAWQTPSNCLRNTL